MSKSERSMPRGRHSAPEEIVRVSASANRVALALVTSSLVFGIVLLQKSMAPSNALSESATKMAHPLLIESPIKPFDYAGYIESAEALLSTPNSMDSATQLLRLATQLAPNEPLVLRASFRVAQAAQRPASAMDHAATLAARSPSDQADAFNALTALVNDPLWNEFASARLQRGWPEADAFLRHLCQRNGRPIQLLAFAHSIARYRPVDEKTLRCVEHILVNSGAIESAYHLRVVAAANRGKLDFVANGEFEQQPDGGPFDWQLTVGGEYRAGFDVSIRSGEDFGRSGSKLWVRFNGRPVKSPIAQQYLALLPGRYRITSVSSATGLSDDAVPAWQLTCREPKTERLEISWTPGNSEGKWLRETGVFMVPTGCAGQHLQLEVPNRLRALEGVRGSYSADSIRIKRL